ncbi:MAG: 23S rRNA (adenine(2503)-C(2))-methyltransferase RlmN [Candidatus Omnitrophica bacterium]|jgi:23S rRNA (adenine2503-C2)-methyltransferase|nr:23S rRNA (adenine(2503)-C(2))-methyltransferase RlmN [Candidatus Omnitrophota bacterium]
MKPDIKDLDLVKLQGVLRLWGYPVFHAKQIFQWIYQKQTLDFNLMSGLPKELRHRLNEEYSVATATIVKSLKSKDGTEKFLLALQDKKAIETVVIPYKDRTSACISSQAGCKFSCFFCASAAKGFSRNLSTGEILEQVSLAKKNFSGLTHLVFMGTGEPLDNYDNVIAAIKIINSKDGFAIGARRITISTCGIIPGIQRLQEEGLQIELSISLHAPDNDLRSRLMPVNKKYPLAALMNACRGYIEKTNRQITFEYILIKDLNSGLPEARKLARILKGMLVKVNLIIANPVKELRIEPPAQEQVNIFKKELIREGVHVTLRQSRGQDIDAACGQLRLKYE